LFEVIERVKNEPGSLKTPEERVEHNHMLVYVYARVVLEGLKWDDPFADWEQLEADALKAVHFLKVTIPETPTVLHFTTDGTTFLHRGSEPLWVWLFPKLLRMLGHPKCPALTSALESLFHFIFLTASRSAGLWNTCEPLFGYLQANFRCKTKCQPAVDTVTNNKSSNFDPFELALPAQPDFIGPRVARP
jgi:serine/threonine-protein kinase ATR